MGWVRFTKAEQAKPGSRMRLRSTSVRRGRPQEYIVSCREKPLYQGVVIVFKGGATIPLKDAKANPCWEVKVDDKDE